MANQRHRLRILLILLTVLCATFFSSERQHNRVITTPRRQIRCRYEKVEVENIQRFKEIISSKSIRDFESTRNFASISRRYNTPDTRELLWHKKTYTLSVLRNAQLLTQHLSASLYGPVKMYPKTKSFECTYTIGGLSLHIDPGGDNIFHWFNEIFLPMYRAVIEEKDFLTGVQASIVFTRRSGYERSETFDISDPEIMLKQLSLPNMKSLLLRVLIDTVCQYAASCRIVLAKLSPQEVLCFENLSLWSYNSKKKDCNAIKCSSRSPYALFETLRSSLTQHAQYCENGHLIRQYFQKIKPGEKKVLIDTRAAAPNRKLKNWKKLVEFFYEKCTGWNVTVLHHVHLLTVVEQILAYSDTDLLVASHGGSTMNLIYMKERSAAIEISASCTRWSWIYDFGYIQAKKMRYLYLPSIECVRNICNLDRNERKSMKPGSRGNIECPELSLDIVDLQKQFQKFRNFC